MKSLAPWALRATGISQHLCLFRKVSQPMPPAARAALTAQGATWAPLHPPPDVIACPARAVQTVTAHFPHVETEAPEGRATCCRSHSWWVTEPGWGVGGGWCLPAPACSLHCPLLHKPLHANPHHRACLGVGGGKAGAPHKAAVLLFLLSPWSGSTRSKPPFHVCGSPLGVRGQGSQPKLLFDPIKDSGPCPFLCGGRGGGWGPQL